MLKISRQQLNTRYDSMPQNLKEFLFSETNSDLLWAIGDTNHLSDDKKSDLATVVGDVILGFIHPDDLAKHITADLNIDSRIAQTVANEIEKKIFYSVMQDLRENYRAIGSETPTLISDVLKPESSDKVGEINIQEFEPRVDLKKEPGEKELGDFFSQLSNSESRRQSVGTPTKTSEMLKVADEAPAIIHKEEEIKPITKTKTSFGGLLGIFKGAGEKKPQVQAIMAEVQFGNQKAEEGGKGKEESLKTGEIKKESLITNNQPLATDLRVVHYSDLRTPITVESEKEKAVKEEENKGVILPPVASPASSGNGVKDLNVVTKNEIASSGTPRNDRNEMFRETQHPSDQIVRADDKTEESPSPLRQLADERGQQASVEINLDHFGEHKENTIQPVKTEQKWKPGGIFSFLKKNKSTNNELDTNKRINEIETQIKEGDKKIESVGVILNGVKKLNIATENEIASSSTPCNDRNEMIRETQHPSDLIVRADGETEKSSDILRPTPMAGQAAQEISNSSEIAKDQPKIINLDEVKIVKEPYKSSLNGEQHKVGKEELEKLMNGEQAKKDQPIGLKNEGGVILSGTKNPNLESVLVKDEMLRGTQHDKTKEKSGGIFGFFKKKPKLVEIDLGLINEVKPLNKPVVADQLQDKKNQVIQKQQTEVKQVDYSEPVKNENIVVSSDVILNGMKDLNVITKNEIASSGAPRNPSDQIVRADDRNEMLRETQHDQIPIQAQPNIENIQLKDLPVHEDTVDLRRL